MYGFVFIFGLYHSVIQWRYWLLGVIVVTNGKFTGKRKVFIDEYVKCLDKSKAARRAGYAYPGQEGHRLLKIAEIRDEVNRIITENTISPEEVLQQL